MAYTSQYPPAQSDTYVKATTKASTLYWPYFATDPTKSLTGIEGNNSWFSANGWTSAQRFHIDLGSAKIVTKIYYENGHASGGTTNVGVQNFTFWGSNTIGNFTDLIYVNNGTWVQLTTSVSAFEQHVALDQADPKYITVTNTTAYQYYAFKFADNYGNANYIAIRRVELQTSDFVDQTISEILTLTDVITPLIFLTSLSETFTFTDTISSFIFSGDLSETLIFTDKVQVGGEIGGIVTRIVTCFPNLSGRHLTLKFVGAGWEDLELYYERLKLSRSKDRSDYDTIFPNLSGTHLTLKIVDESDSSFEIYYSSLGMLKYIE